MKRILPISVACVAIVLASMATVAQAAPHKKADPSCSIAPNPAAVGTAYTISAMGLPTTDPVWLIVSPPSGYSSVSEVYVAADGSWSGPASGDPSGGWTYVFSGLLTDNKYGAVATCSVQVT